MSKKLIRFDWAIKRLLRNKANFVVLEGFLSELLFENVKIEQILESESNQETDDDKFNRVDILSQNSKNELIIIEIQNTYDLRSNVEYLEKINKRLHSKIDYFHRMVYGVSKSISENLKLGQKYLEIKKAISINIVYFDLGHGQDYIYRGKTDFKGIHENDILGLTTKQKETFSKEEVYQIFLEYYILKVNQFNDVAKDTLDEWMYFLKNSEVKDSFNAKGLREANEVLDIMRLPDDDQYGYNRYLDNLHFKASEIFTLQTEAEFKVREDEKLKNTVEIAKKSILKGFNNEIIAEITGLTIEKIEGLRKKLGY
jgi:hypothetical protein